MEERRAGDLPTSGRGCVFVPRFTEKRRNLPSEDVQESKLGSKLAGLRSGLQI